MAYHRIDDNCSWCACRDVCNKREEYNKTVNDYIKIFNDNKCFDKEFIQIDIRCIYYHSDVANQDMNIQNKKEYQQDLKQRILKLEEEGGE